MSSIIVRPATNADLDTLLRFEQGVIVAERPFDPTLKPDPNSYYDLPYMLTAPEVELVVAEQDSLLITSIPIMLILVLCMSFLNTAAKVSTG